MDLFSGALPGKFKAGTPIAGGGKGKGGKNFDEKEDGGVHSYQAATLWRNMG